MWHNKEYSDWNPEPMFPFKAVAITIILVVLVVVLVWSAAS